MPELALPVQPGSAVLSIIIRNDLSLAMIRGHTGLKPTALI